MKECFKLMRVHFKFKYVSNILAIACAIVVLVILQNCSLLSRSVLSLLVRISYSIILAVSLNLVVGFLGELSLGHAGFMCVGAYTAGVLANALRSVIPNQFVLLLICLVAGAILAAAFGFLIGLPALRLKGDYLAIVTLAFGEIVRNLCKNIPLLGGNVGLTTSPIQSKKLWVIGLILVILVIFLSQNFIRSSHGRCVTAIRDNEIAARAMGVRVTYYKLFVFMLSAAFAGIAGVIYSFYTTPLLPTFFSYNYSIEILVMVVLGGIGSINGSIIAAILLAVLNMILQNNLSGDLASLQYMIYSIILIVIILFGNAPAFIKIREKLNLKKLLKLRKNSSPDLIRDDEAAWHRVPTKINMDELLSVEADKEERK